VNGKRETVIHAASNEFNRLFLERSLACAADNGKYVFSSVVKQLVFTLATAVPQPDMRSGRVHLRLRLMGSSCVSKYNKHLWAQDFFADRRLRRRFGFSSISGHRGLCNTVDRCGCKNRNKAGSLCRRQIVTCPGGSESFYFRSQPAERTCS
jgi:hypothetical protein